jgi:hypothetical protein
MTKTQHIIRDYDGDWIVFPGGIYQIKGKLMLVKTYLQRPQFPPEYNYDKNSFTAEQIKDDGYLLISMRIVEDPQ